MAAVNRLTTRGRRAHKTVVIVQYKRLQKAAFRHSLKFNQLISFIDILPGDRLISYKLDSALLVKGFLKFNNTTRFCPLHTQIYRSVI